MTTTLDDDQMNFGAVNWITIELVFDFGAIVDKEFRIKFLACEVAVIGLGPDECGIFRGFKLHEFRSAGVGAFERYKGVFRTMKVQDRQWLF